MTKDDRIRKREGRLEAFGLKDTPDDRYWARMPDLAGVGVLHRAEEREGRLQVEIRCGSVALYLDTTNIASFGDLHNLKGLPIDSRVAFTGNVRSITERGVRLGRLTVEGCDTPMEQVVFTPQVRMGGQIMLGEGSIPDPGEAWGSFLIASQGRGLSLVPCGGK